MDEQNPPSQKILYDPSLYDINLIHQIAPCTYEIPIGFAPNMKVHSIFFATPEIAELAFEEFRLWAQNPVSALPSILQLAFAATLDGITEASYGMPDIHSGYGFPIGGVAAFDTSDPNALISPGAVGLDINCGIRCLTTHLTVNQIQPRINELISKISKLVPAGVAGKRGNFITQKDIPEICLKGAEWAIQKGYGVENDLECCEEHGRMSFADPSLVPERALNRGIGQLGTLGSGNHFIEIQAVDQIFNDEAASIMGVKSGEVVVTIHTGSRGLGSGVAEAFTQEVSELPQHNILPDKQLSSAPYKSEIGQRYFKCMAAAANYAWANRQIITHFVRNAFNEIFGDVQMDLIYDVSHNIAKIETHGGKEYIVHRKGATRSFGPGRIEIPLRYRQIGQPVLIGGSMGTASYILIGDDRNKCFGSTCHGAGRTMSRSKATRDLNVESVSNELNDKGVVLKAVNKKTILEEAPEAYKDIEAVVNTCESVGLSKRVARLTPLGVVKG